MHLLRWISLNHIHTDYIDNNMHTGLVSDILSFVFSKGLAGLGMQAMPGVPEGINQQCAIYKRKLYFYCLMIVYK